MTETAAAEPTLTYFDMRGHAEATRLMLEDLGVTYRDRRIRTRDEWQSVRRTAPFGSLPLYDEPGLSLPESHAILRYLGRRHALDGEDERAKARGDATLHALAEAQEALWRFNWVKSYTSMLAEYGAPHGRAPENRRII